MVEVASVGVPQRGQLVGVCVGESGNPQLMHFIVIVSRSYNWPHYISLLYSTNNSYGSKLCLAEWATIMLLASLTEPGGPHTIMLP